MEVSEYYARSGAVFEVELLSEMPIVWPGTGETAPVPERATIRIKTFVHSPLPGQPHESGIAVYGDERPIEFWRRVATFVEAK